MATFTESFDQADSTTLGPDLTWTEVAGEWQTIGSLAAMDEIGVNAYARAESDTGSADMYVEAVLPVESVFTSHYIDHQIMVRMDPAAITGYVLVRGYWSSAGGQFAMLRKYVNGVESEVAAPVKLSASLPEAWRVEVEGTAVRAYRDGILILSGTDTQITAGTHGGLGGYRSSATDNVRLIRFNTFEVGALGDTPPDPDPDPDPATRYLLTASGWAAATTTIL